MDIETDTVKLPAFLASALINGDTSGMDNPQDLEMLARVESWLTENRWHVTDVGEQYFGVLWHGPAIGQWAFHGDLADYVIYRTKL